MHENTALFTRRTGMARQYKSGPHSFAGHCGLKSVSPKQLQPRKRANSTKVILLSLFGQCVADGLRRFELSRLAFALVRVKVALADPDRLRRHLDQLVVLDIGDRLLKAHPPRRS